MSRQLWWGHRILGWYVTFEDDELREFGAYNDHWIVGWDLEEAKNLASKNLEEGPVVLDTWFSSGVFPFAVTVRQGIQLTC